MDEGGLQGQAEFSNELQLLSRLKHPHLVRLVGCCWGSGGAGSSSGGGAALVYELMPGGSIDTHLNYKVRWVNLPEYYNCCCLTVEQGVHGLTFQVVCRPGHDELHAGCEDMLCT